MMISGTRFTCRKRAHILPPDHIVTTDMYGSMHASNKLPIPASREKKRERERERDPSPFIRIYNFQPKKGARVYTVTVKPFYRGVFFLRLRQLSSSSSSSLLDSFQKFAQKYENPWLTDGAARTTQRSKDGGRTVFSERRTAPGFLVRSEVEECLEYRQPRAREFVPLR